MDDRLKKIERYNDISEDFVVLDKIGAKTNLVNEMIATYGGATTLMELRELLFVQKIRITNKLIEKL